jgi:ubiquinone/menaquinone biosynthesis C-methylase UbiE
MPEHLSDHREGLAGTFRFPGVAAAYAYRPPYPVEVFELLDSLTVDEPRRALDLGAGDGEIARPLAERVDWVDAVEISPAMVAAGRQRPGGDRSNLAWHVEAAETTSVTGPYALVTAGASLHWMDGPRTLARVARVLTPNGVFAVVDQKYQGLRWTEALRPVIVRHSRNPGYRPGFSVTDQLAEQGLLRIRGQHHTEPMTFRQSVHDYVEQFFSTASLARELMSPDEAAGFAQETTAIVRGYADADGLLPVATVASVVWGDPAATGRS